MRSKSVAANNGHQTSQQNSLHQSILMKYYSKALQCDTNPLKMLDIHLFSLDNFHAIYIDKYTYQFINQTTKNLPSVFSAPLRRSSSGLTLPIYQ